MAPDFPWWPQLDLSLSEERVWLQWVIRLRWVAIVGQVLTLSAVARILSSPVLLFPLLAVTGVLTLVNVASVRALKSQRAVVELTLVKQLLVDVFALTLYFLLCGGPDNPFCILYLIHVAMGAVMLSPARSAWVGGAVLVSYLSLHFVHLPLELQRHRLGETTLMHLGQGVAFVLTVLSVGVFVQGLSNSLRRREAQLTRVREQSARTDRLRAVGTLAAGAAHELNTPLSTIALRLGRVERRHSEVLTVGDLAAIREQLGRCNTIVRQLLVGAGDPSASDLGVYGVADLVRGTTKWWRKDEQVVHFSPIEPSLRIRVPRVAFIQGLVNLLENGLEAQAENGESEPLELEVRYSEGIVEVIVSDRGAGLPDDVDRVGDPFFTTKVDGTGLGVFVVRAIADGAGGGLRYERVGGGGTKAIWSFPLCLGDENDKKNSA